MCTLYICKTFIHTISREKINSAIMCKKLLDYYNISDMKIFNSGLRSRLEKVTNNYHKKFIKILLFIY